MVQFKDLCIPLRTVPFRERDRILTVFSQQHGLLSVMAKNAIGSRRFGLSLDVFTAADWLLSRGPGRDLFLVTEAQTRYSFEKIKKDFDRLSSASLMAQILLKLLQPEHSVPAFFARFCQLLYALDAPANSPQVVLILFFVQVLKWQGATPEVHRCQECALSLETLVQRQQGAEFDLHKGGWFCADCRPPIAFSKTQNPASGTCSAHDLLCLHQCLSAPLATDYTHLHTLQQELPASFTWTFGTLLGFIRFQLPGFDQADALPGLRFLSFWGSQDQSHAL